MNRSKVLAGAAMSALAAFCYAGAASATTVTIPDPTSGTFDFFGAGDASVTYDGVVFSASSALGDGNLFDVGPGFSGSPSVLSDQQESSGVANILITLPAATKSFSVTYGTFDGSDVSFTLSNGASFTEPSTGSGFGIYTTPDFQSFSSAPFTSVLLTVPNPDAIDIRSISFGAVPEPASWAIMLVGFGGVGAAMRSRRKVVAVAA